MDKLTFKTFTWPTNPETYQEEAARKPLYNNYDSFTGLGPVKRVITGSGSFLGIQAAEHYSALAALFADGTAGTLTHPVWGERTVFFTGLEMTQAPGAYHVAYRFTFTEADENGAIPQ